MTGRIADIDHGCRAGKTADHRHRRHVQVWAFSRPLGEDLIDSGSHDSQPTGLLST